MGMRGVLIEFVFPVFFQVKSYNWLTQRKSSSPSTYYTILLKGVELRRKVHWKSVKESVWLWESGDFKVVNIQEGCTSVSPGLPLLPAEQAPFFLLLLKGQVFYLLDPLEILCSTHISIIFTSWFWWVFVCWRIQYLEYGLKNVKHKTLSSFWYCPDYCEIFLAASPLLAHVELTVPQGTQIPALELFPWGYSLLGAGLGHPTPVCPMNIQPKPPCKNAWDALILNTWLFASFQTKYDRIFQL